MIEKAFDILLWIVSNSILSLIVVGKIYELLNDKK